MSEFKMKPQRARATVQDMNSIARQMKNLEDEILKIQRGLSFEVAQKERIRQRLRTAGNNTAKQYKGIYNSSSTLNNIVNIYETTERRLSGSKVPQYEMLRDTLIDNIKNDISLMPIFPFAPSGFIPSIIAPGRVEDKLPCEITYGYEKSEVENKFGKGSWDFDEDKYKLKREEKETYVSINNEHDEVKQSKIEPFKLWQEKWKDTKSELHAEGTVGDKDGSHANYKFDVLKREASAEIYAGLYYTDPSTGEKKLRAAAGASVGYTLSALSTSAEAQLGDSNLGLYVKGEAAAGKVEAKASGVIGLRDAEGKFNPTAHGKLSVEAIAAEASVKGGIKVAGADVGVKASVNVGIGAHAEAGYKDGVFSLDIGASVGIGGSVKLEVDVDGMVDAVCGKVQSAWSALTGWFK